MSTDAMKPHSCCAGKTDTDPTDQEPDTAHCPVRTTLALIGGKYKVFILWALFEGTLRFNQIQKAVPQANAKMLSQQLKELERDGLIDRKAYPVIPPRVEYSLTPLGQSLRPVLACIYRWGTAYLAEMGLSAHCTMKPLGEEPPASAPAGESQAPSCYCHK